MRAEIFWASIKGDRRASDRKSVKESRDRGALRWSDLVNHDRKHIDKTTDNSVGASLCSHEGKLKKREERSGGGDPGFDVKMLTLSSVLGTGF